MHQYRVPPPALRLDPIATALMQMWQRPRPALRLQARGTNKEPWTGILCFVDQPSDLPPGGADNHRVLLPRAIAATKLQTLIGMPINADTQLLDHDMSNIVGQISRAWLDGNKLMVSGWLFDKSNQALVARIQSQKALLGMSYELSGASIRDTSASIWTLDDWEFTGASVLLKTKAAYQSTAIAARRHA